MLRGEIRPIIKNCNEDKSDCDNYRPVMNSSCLYKIFEYSLLPKIKHFMTPHEHQFGFRENTGCLSATFVLKETILKYNSLGSDVHCSMIDLSKAFDKMNINILIMQLIRTKMPPLLINIIKFLCENVYVCVVVNNERGRDFKVGNGARQGGVLSPFLFNFYINEVMQTISSMSVGCRLNNVPCNIIGYADDMLLCAPSSSGLQKLVNKFCAILDALCLPINYDKSLYIIFKSRKNKFVDNSIILNNKVLVNVNDCKYLGILLCDTKNIDDDVNRCMYSFLKQFNAIFYKFNFLSVDALTFLIRTHCTSFYGSEMWLFNDSYCNRINKLSIAYHKAIKRILNMAPWDSNHTACERSNMPIFKHFLNSRILSFSIGLLNSNSRCLDSLKYYIRYDSFLIRRVNEIFKSQYNVENVFNNDIEAVRSRINFIQRTEERSNYVFIP